MIKEADWQKNYWKSEYRRLPDIIKTKNVNMDGSDTTLFKGYFKNGVKHSIGMEIYNTDQVFYGNFHNGQKEGEGIYRGINASMFNGSYLDDMKHGHGIQISEGGIKYEGQWQQNQKHGQGVETNLKNSD